YSILFSVSLFCFAVFLTQSRSHSSPTRRSSDLTPTNHRLESGIPGQPRFAPHVWGGRQADSSSTYNLRHVWILAAAAGKLPSWGDRKSTRLNSSHVKISYAVFCLKKKI